MGKRIKEETIRPILAARGCRLKLFKVEWNIAGS
jgi:hypothetical protein